MENPRTRVVSLLVAGAMAVALAGSSAIAPAAGQQNEREAEPAGIGAYVLSTEE